MAGNVLSNTGWPWALGVVNLTVVNVADLVAAGLESAPFAYDVFLCASLVCVTKDAALTVWVMKLWNGSKQMFSVLIEALRGVKVCK